MSAFSHHDELPHLCEFCDHDAELIGEEGGIQEMYQLIPEEGAPKLLCAHCWWIARRGTNPVNITIYQGVHTIRVPREMELRRPPEPVAA